jgi:hypothetical protein
VVRVHLESEAGDLALHAELPHERWQALDLQAGDTVRVAPRRVRIFVEEELSA